MIGFSSWNQSLVLFQDHRPLSRNQILAKTLSAGGRVESDDDDDDDDDNF